MNADFIVTLFVCIWEKVSLARNNQSHAAMAYFLLSPSQLTSNSQREGKTISKTTGQELTSNKYLQTNSTKSESAHQEYCTKTHGLNRTQCKTVDWYSQIRYTVPESQKINAQSREHGPVLTEVAGHTVIAQQSDRLCCQCCFGDSRRRRGVGDTDRESGAWQGRNPASSQSGQTAACGLCC